MLTYQIYQRRESYQKYNLYFVCLCGQKKFGESSFKLINNYNSPPFPSNPRQNYFPFPVMNQVIYKYIENSIWV